MSVAGWWVVLVVVAATVLGLIAWAEIDQARRYRRQRACTRYDPCPDCEDRP